MTGPWWWLVGLLVVASVILRQNLLFLMALGYTFLFFVFWIVRMRTEILNRRSKSLLEARGQ